jgi:beta-ureidopropionase
VGAGLNFFERDGDRTFDSSPVIDADGSLLGVTRMVHITEYACFHEQGYYTPGDTGAPVYATRAGKIGVAICYDRHFPEYMRALALGGADLVVVPQAGATGEWPEGLYEAEMRVAAFQNGYFTALCNRVGQEDCLDFAGESFVCDPNGVVIARAAQGTRTRSSTPTSTSRSRLNPTRAGCSCMRHRRPTLYGGPYFTGIPTSESRTIARRRSASPKTNGELAW